MLDTSVANSVAVIIFDTLEETGYNDPTEAIPGLIQAIVRLADGDDRLLDEAANLLADGGVKYA